MSMSGRGGIRPNAGRKRSAWGSLIRKDVRLNSEMIAYCKSIGVGDFSEGVRIAVDQSMRAATGESSLKEAESTTSGS